MGDSVFVVLPKGITPPKTLEVILSPQDFGLKTANDKTMARIKEALKKTPLQMYSHERKLLGIGTYTDAYAENGKIHASYQMNGAKHNAT